MGRRGLWCCVVAVQQLGHCGTTLPAKTIYRQNPSAFPAAVLPSAAVHSRAAQLVPSLQVGPAALALTAPGVPPEHHADLPLLLYLCLYCAVLAASAALQLVLCHQDLLIGPAAHVSPQVTACFPSAHTLHSHPAASGYYCLSGAVLAVLLRLYEVTHQPVTVPACHALYCIFWNVKLPP